jgi:hypothetical protein
MPTTRYPFVSSAFVTCALALLTLAALPDQGWLPPRRSRPVGAWAPSAPTIAMTPSDAIRPRRQATPSAGHRAPTSRMVLNICK